jgi:hypothetical protein
MLGGRAVAVRMEAFGLPKKRRICEILQCRTSSSVERHEMGFQSALLVGVGAMFFSHGVNRYLGERNFKQLSPDEKVRLVDQFSSVRSAGTYLPIAIMGLVILLTMAYPQAFRWFFPIGVGAILLVSFALQVLIFRQLAVLELPDDFVSRYRFQAFVVLCGNVVALYPFFV